MGEEGRAINYGISQSERRRSVSSEYSGPGRLELSSKWGAFWRRRYHMSNDSLLPVLKETREAAPYRYRDSQVIDAKAECNVPRMPQLPCRSEKHQSVLSFNSFDFLYPNECPQVTISQEFCSTCGHYYNRRKLCGRRGCWFCFRPNFCGEQLYRDFVNKMQSDNPVAKWSPELQPPDESSGTSYDTYSYSIAKLFPPKSPARKRNKQTSALPSNGAKHQWIEQHHEVDDDLNSDLEDSVSYSWGVENLTQWKQSFGMGRSRTWRYCRFLKSNRLCKPTKYPARLFERTSWGNGAKLPLTLGRCIRPAQSVMSIKKPRKKAGYYDSGHLGPEIQENQSWSINNCNSELDM